MSRKYILCTLLSKDRYRDRRVACDICRLATTHLVDLAVSSIADNLDQLEYTSRIL